LEEEYARVVNLIDAIQTHLASQAEESQRMARSLERLAESLSHVPDASRQELELLTRIQDSMTADLAGTKRIEDCLSQLPQLADAQREAMVSIGRQLDSSRETSERVASTLGEVQQAVGGLGEATDASAKAVQELRHDASARGERIAELVKDQTRRLTTLAWAMIGLAVVAAVVALVAVIR
jgi:gas vesicle protein